MESFNNEKIMATVVEKGSKYYDEYKIVEIEYSEPKYVSQRSIDSTTKNTFTEVKPVKKDVAILLTRDGEYIGNISFSVLHDNTAHVGISVLHKGLPKQLSCYVENAHRYLALHLSESYIEKMANGRMQRYKEMTTSKINTLIELMLKYSVENGLDMITIDDTIDSEYSLDYQILGARRILPDFLAFENINELVEENKHKL